MSPQGPRRGLYIALFSVHGLLRGKDPELGRDADTGGQILYVRDLARALAAHRGVERVELITRLIRDPKVGPGYDEPLESLGPKVKIVRLPFGPRRYLRKEVLWPHLSSLIDEALRHFRHVGRVPDLLHGHYADAGLVAARLGGILGVPVAFTGHSLGHVKRDRLLAKGASADKIESRFHLATRIEAEEAALDATNLVVASTEQERDAQYAQYASFHPERCVVIPPGVDLGRFAPPSPKLGEDRASRLIDRFLTTPRRPLVLAISRADPRKNIPALIRAFGEHPRLRERANLAIVAGVREDITELDREPREVMNQVLLEIDRQDLWGQVALPKQHEPDDVPELYRLAARRRGVFVNPALTEPFGLTLLEAAASGLPVVATDDGGPRDILRHCQNGSLVDVLDTEAMGEAIWRVIDDPRWRELARNGQRGCREHFSWEGHANRYIQAVRSLARRSNQIVVKREPPRGRLVTAEHVLVCDIDNTLTGDRAGARRLRRFLRERRDDVAFVIATGRHLQSAIEILEEWKLPEPDVFITSVGSEIHYGSTHREDTEWARHLDYRWEAEKVQEAMAEIEGCELQAEENQRAFKCSYLLERAHATKAALAGVRRHLRERGVKATIIHSHGRYLDVMPLRASKGKAIRFLGWRYGVPMNRVLTAGDSGNDEEMLVGGTLGIVVSNHSEELGRLRGRDRVLFTRRPHAWGVLEGLAHYGVAPLTLIDELPEIEDES